MSTTRSFFDFTMAFTTAIGTAINSRTGAANVSLSGIGTLKFNTDGTVTATDGDTDGEVDPSAEMYGALGLLGRPLEPETLGGKKFSAEAIAARSGDGLVPLGWRDLRFERYFPNGIPKGTIRMVGYGGGFASLDVTSGTAGANRTNTHTVYIPYQFDANGVPAKCHAIVVDPDPANGITMTHGDGFQVALTSDGIMCRTPDANTYTMLRAGEFTICAAKINLKGGVLVGMDPDPSHFLPLSTFFMPLPGPAVPPTGILFAPK